MQPHATTVARHQKALILRDTARQTIESCRFLLALPGIDSATIFAIDSKDSVAVTHLHRFVAALDRSLGSAAFLKISQIGDALAIEAFRKSSGFWTGERAKKALESEVRFQEKADAAWTREIDRAAALYSLPSELKHSIPIVG